MKTWFDVHRLGETARMFAFEGIPQERKAETILRSDQANYEHCPLNIASADNWLSCPSKKSQSHDDNKEDKDNGATLRIYLYFPQMRSISSDEQIIVHTEMEQIYDDTSS